jgi:hypothetical protein
VTSDKRKYRIGILLFLIIGVALFLRVSTVDRHGIWIDETWNVSTPNFHYDSDSIYPKFFEYPEIKTLHPRILKIIRNIYDMHPFAQVCFMMVADVHPPFYYMLSYCWTRIFGESIYAIRSLPIVMGLFTILFLFLTIRLIFNDRIAVLSAWLLALSPTHVLYSQLARHYSLLIFLVVLSFFFLYKYIIYSKKKYLIGYFASIYFSILTQYYAVFFIIPQLIIIISYETKKRGLSRWLVGFFIVTVLYIAWLPALYIQIFLRDATAHTGLMSFSLNTLLKQFYYVGICPSVSQEFVSATVFQFLRILNFVVIFTMFILGIYGRDHFQYAAHIFLWALLPISILSVLCIFKPLYSLKGLSPLIPAFTTAFAIGLGRICKKRLTFAVSVFLISLVMIFTQAKFPVYPGIQPTEDTRGAIAKLSKLINPSDCVVVQPGFYRDGLWYYLKRDYIQLEKNKDLKGLEKCSKVWIFRYWDKGQQIPLLGGNSPSNIWKFKGLSVYYWES